MFLGRHLHTIDAKGRVSIPADMRMLLQSQDPSQPPIITKGAGPCLSLYPHNVWRDRAQRLISHAFPQPKVQAFRRYVAGGAKPCPLDAQGRILIPPFLREEAGLEREVMIVGVVDSIEIWDKERFEQDLQETEQNIDEISAEVAKLGL